MIARTRLALLFFAALGAAACGGSETESATTTPRATTLPPTTAATTLPPPTTTTTTLDTSAVESLGYPVSDEWVVETVVAGVDAGTGGLALDADGSIYLADFGYRGHPGNAIYRVSPDGTVETHVESEAFQSLTMTRFGPDGRLYQSSYGSGEVFVVEPDGTVTTVASGLDGPTGLVVLEDGTLFVEAYDGGVIHRVLPDGTVEDWATHPRFRGINGLTRSPDGTLYAVNHKDGGLFSVDADGTAELLTRFPGANSHVVYHEGSLFITSRGSYVVYRWDLATGEAEIIAGNGLPGDQDGRGPASSFGRPNAITVGPDGALYINHGEARSGNPVTVRRISHQP